MSPRRSVAAPRVLLLFLTLACATALACVGPALLQNEPLDAGPSLVFRAEPDRVLGLALEAMREAELTLDRRLVLGEDAWMLLGSRVLSEREAAVAVRVVVRGTAAGETSVHVLSRRRLPTEITVGGGDPYADAILSHIAGRLMERP